MYNIFYSPNFEKDRALAIRRGLNVAKLDEAVVFNHRMTKTMKALAVAGRATGLA